MDMTFGKQIRALRMKAGLTQQAMAALLEVKKTRYASWEYDGKEPDKRLQKIFIEAAQAIYRNKDTLKTVKVHGE